MPHDKIRPAIRLHPTAGHPFSTGAQRDRDASGSVERFERRYGAR
ncbi:50S ribosomal protein L31 [Streptomyces sp. R-07]